MTKVIADTQAPSDLTFTRAIAVDAYWAHISTRTEEQLSAIERVLDETLDEKLALAYALTEAAKTQATIISCLRLMSTKNKRERLVRPLLLNTKYCRG